MGAGAAREACRYHAVFCLLIYKTPHDISMHNSVIGPLLGFLLFFFFSDTSPYDSVLRLIGTQPQSRMVWVSWGLGASMRGNLSQPVLLHTRDV